jgi:hypothetical protein
MAITIRRNLPWGRVSSAGLQTDGADKIPDSVRKAGYQANGNKASVGEYMDQIAYESQFDVILGNAAQLAIDAAQITWSNSNARFENKAGTEVVLGDYSRVAVIGMDTLTANMVIDNVIGLQMFHLGGTQQQSGDNPKFQLGDAGSGVPYKILLGSSTENCKLDLMTDKPFIELPFSFTQTQKQYVANQGKNNHILVNGEEIYNPSEAGHIVTLDTIPVNPYLLRMNGALWPWQSNAAVDGLAWFRDLNIRLDGIRYNGTSYDESNSRFTLPAAIGSTPYFFQLNSANRFFTDISVLDSLVHQRTDPTGVSVADTGAFVNGSNVVTFTSGANVKNNMRLNGASSAGIPDASSGTPGTTILKDVNTTAKTASMYDALTGAAVNAVGTGSVAITLDNSGAAGGSQDTDYFQGHIFYNGVADDANLAYVYGSTVNEAPGVAVNSVSTQTPPAPTLQGLTSNPKTDGVNGTPRTHDQTQPKSTGVQFYYKA